jgi:hypothetical protein
MNTSKNILSIESHARETIGGSAHITDVHEESIQVKTSNLEVFDYTKQVARYLICYPLKQNSHNITLPVHLPQWLIEQQEGKDWYSLCDISNQYSQ